MAEVASADAGIPPDGEYRGYTFIAPVFIVRAATWQEASAPSTLATASRIASSSRSPVAEFANRPEAIAGLIETLSAQARGPVIVPTLGVSAEVTGGRTDG